MTKAPMSSPFQRLVVTDWNDGEREGYAIRGDGAAFWFERLDEDRDGVVRVFAVYAIDASESDVNLAFGPPERLPVWIPKPPFPARSHAFYDASRASKRPVALVAAPDLVSDLVVWRPIDVMPQASNWFTLLGLHR